MYMDSEKFENWMERIMERFDRTEKLLERVLKKSNALDGEEVLDNQDLCLLLKVGIRTLQRYRAIGILPYFTISGKVFYRVKDVQPVPPQPVCRCGGTGCKTEGEGSPERGKAQEKRLVSVKVIFPL